MADHPTTVATTLSARSAAHRSAADHQCRPVRRSQRLSVADAARRFSEVEDGLRHLLDVAERRHVGANSCGTPPEGSPGGREEGHADGRDSRQPVDPHGGGRRRTGLRRGEKGHRPEASLGRRHARDGARGCRSKRLLAGPRRGLLCPDATARTVPTDQSSLRRQRLWPERSAGVSPRHIRLGAANRAPSGRSERLRRAAQTLDRGTHVRLAGPVSPAQPRLREDHRLGRSDDLHRHDQLDVQTPRAKRKLIFKTRSEAVSRKKVHRFVFSKDAKTAIINAITGAVETLDLTQGIIRASPPNGGTETIRILENPTNYGEFDVDDITTNEALDVSDIKASWFLKKMLKIAKQTPQITMP